VGKKILAQASSGLKRVILELGGKDPMVVGPGADMQRAAKFAAGSSFRNAGQVCVSTERIYVLRDQADAFVEKLVEATEKMKVGDGMEEGTRVGPMINARQRDHVLAQIDEAVSQGATVVYGGQGHHDNFVTPTVLRGVTHDMAIAREETFGPVACVIEVDDIDEAVRLANDTDYGLGATVWGAPGEKTVELARKIHAGMVGINKSCGGVANTPWVGAKESGYGFHSSVEGHRQFAQVQVVTEKL
jgi:succinate-semialdehyde dehydrogenase/glutarate-semialdehyde dehydrogenase